MPAKLDHWLPTRTSLLRRLKRWDDQSSWREFFDTYSKLIYTVAVRAGFRDPEAQDIVQETIIAVAKRMPSFHYDPKIGSFKAWLFRIARRRIIDHLRKRQTNPQDQPPPPSAAPNTSTDVVARLPDPHDIDQIWNQEWHQHVLDGALAQVKAKVSDKEFQIFDCYVLKQWPVQTVATTLRVSEAHVYVAKSRVSALLRKEIRRREEAML